MNNNRRVNSIRHNYNVNFDFDPLNSSQTQNSYQKPYSDTSIDENLSLSTSNESGNIDLIWNNEKLPDIETVNNTKELGHLATLFLQVRKGIMDDCNYDISHNERLEQEREHHQNNQPIIKKMSNSTLHRAEKVKLMFNLYYFSLFQSQKLLYPQYKGVDAVYNPLQIIRNRSLRKKYHQFPQISVKILALSSSAFSKQKKKLIWEIELAELAHDFTWRTQYWHELVNSQGELWFPLNENPHHHRNKLNRPNNSKVKEQSKEMSNIYDKLFNISNGDESESEIENEIEIENESENEDKSEKFIESDQNSIIPNISPRNDPSNSLQKTKKDNPNEKIKAKSSFKKRDQSLIQEDISDKFKNTELSIQETLKTKTLNDINIKLLEPHERNNSDDKLNNNTTSDHKNQQEINIGFSQHEELKLLNSYFEEMNYLDAIINFSPHDYEYRRLEYINLLKRKNKFDAMHNEVSNHILKKLRTGIMKNYESLLKEKSNELRDIQNELVNEYSTKIDKMLTLSDRTIGEVNTTLALEIRKLSERFEKVGGPVYKKSDSVINFLYWVLENLVVIILWSIWIGFSIGRTLKYCFMLIWRIIKWIIL